MKKPVVKLSEVSSRMRDLLELYSQRDQMFCNRESAMGFVREYRSEIATLIRASLVILEQSCPGRSVEVRVPPFGAVQCCQGPSHTRGVPPNTWETDPLTWLRICVGDLSIEAAKMSGSVHISGLRAQELNIFQSLWKNEL